INKGVSFDRDALLAEFKINQIDARVFFWPLSLLPMFKTKFKNTVSHDLYSRAINLPSYHELTEIEMDRVIKLVKDKVCP
ncbi:MAG: DegT/DnrJ/EryC1/StrS family aminotransferase, partial [Gammaproteobacteria bacterium]|nr:DegT/DnrJ/EryC1/StrS family aminotransferase [Gammaproteobacteria bacterium]